MENNASKQLWTVALPKNQGGKEEIEIFPRTPQLISLHLEAWGSFRCFFLVFFCCFFFFPLTQHCFDCCFCIYFSFWQSAIFFSKSLKSGNAKLWRTLKRIAHTKECRELYLRPQMHTVLDIVFESTQWFSFHFAWQNPILCVLWHPDLIHYCTDQSETIYRFPRCLHF